MCNAIRASLWVSLLIARSAAGGVGAGPSPSDLARVEQLQNTLAAVAEGVRPSVVVVRAARSIEVSDRGDDRATRPHDEVNRDRAGRRWSQERKFPAVGSGIVIRADGLILTNEHVVARARPEDITCTLSNSETYRVQAVSSDPRRDLAVLKIDAQELTPARLGDLSEVKQGHFAIVMGNPFGSASDSHGRPAMSFGIISALGRGLTRQLDPMMTQRYYGNLIQTDARVNPGNSGGPLLNIKGEVIGLNTAISTRSGSSEGVGYAIPMSKRTREIIAQLARGEEVDYGFLGVGLRSATAADERGTATAPAIGGAVVASVEFGTPAAAANLQEGDVITSFDGQPVHDADELICLVGAARVGVRVNLTLYRGQHRLIVPIVPARRKMPAPSIFTWRGVTFAHADWEVCRTFKLPVDVRGAVVTEVEDESAAAKAGLEPGQVVCRIGDVKIHGIRKLPQITRELAGPVDIEVLDNPPIQLQLP